MHTWHGLHYKLIAQGENRRADSFWAGCVIIDGVIYSFTSPVQDCALGCSHMEGSRGTGTRHPSLYYVPVLEIPSDSSRHGPPNEITRIEVLLSSRLHPLKVRHTGATMGALADSDSRAMLDTLQRGRKPLSATDAESGRRGALAPSVCTMLRRPHCCAAGYGRRPTYIQLRAISCVQLAACNELLAS